MLTHDYLRVGGRDWTGSSLQRLLLALLLLYSLWCTPTSATLIVYGPNSTISVPTMDAARHVEPEPYRFSGTIATWPWDISTGHCTLLSPTAIRSNLRSQAQAAKRAGDFAVMLYFVANADRFTVTAANQTVMNDMARAGCSTVAHVVQAVQRLSQQLTDGFGFPPVRLTVLLGLSMLEVPLWGPKTGAYTASLAGVPEGIPSERVALVAPEHSAKFVTAFQGRYQFMNFVVHYEAGPWNDFYLSTAYSVFRWTLFSMLLIGLLYALARLVRLHIISGLKINLELFIMFLSCLTATMLLIRIAYGELTFVGLLLEVIVAGYSSILLDTAVWLWSTRYRHVFAVSFLYCIRGFVVVQLLATLCSTMVNMFLIFSDAAEHIARSMVYAANYLPPVVSALTLLVYLITAMRFFYVVREVRGTGMYRPLLRMAMLAAIVTPTYLSNTLDNGFVGYRADRFMNNTVLHIVALESVDLMSYTLRILFGLTIMGVGWPMPDKSLPGRIAPEKSAAGKGHWLSNWLHSLSTHVPQRQRRHKVGVDATAYTSTGPYWGQSSTTMGVPQTVSVLEQAQGVCVVDTPPIQPTVAEIVRVESPFAAGARSSSGSSGRLRRAVTLPNVAALSMSRCTLVPLGHTPYAVSLSPNSSLVMAAGTRMAEQTDNSMYVLPATTTTLHRANSTLSLPDASQLGDLTSLQRSILEDLSRLS